MHNSEMVLVEKLVKVYPGATRAVSGIDFTIAPGEFFGLLGLIIALRTRSAQVTQSTWLYWRVTA